MRKGFGFVDQEIQKDFEEMKRGMRIREIIARMVNDVGYEINNEKRDHWDIYVPSDEDLKATTLDEILTKAYGPKGSIKRTEAEIKIKNLADKL